MPAQGALVANYPWDGTPDESTRYEASPDDATFRHLASLYASTHQIMALANNTVGCLARPAATRWAPGRQPHVSRLVRLLNQYGCWTTAKSMLRPRVAWLGSNRPCPLPCVQEFPHGGTTNGAAWYPIYGSMQVGSGCGSTCCC